MRKYNSYSFARFVFDVIDVFGHPLQNLKSYKDINIEKDIVYDDEYPNDRLLDIYYHKDNDFSKPSKVVLNIHGGGFLAGDRKHRKSISKYFASLGFIVFNISYCLAPKYTYLEMANSYVKAMNFIAKCQEKYNLSLNDIVVTGDSAGGHATLLVNSLLVNQDVREKLKCDEFDERLNIGLLIPCCGCFDGYKLFDNGMKTSIRIAEHLTRENYKNIEQMRGWEYFNEFSPLYHVNEKFAPAYIIHTKYDMFCPHQGEFLIQEYEKYNIEYNQYFAKRFFDGHCFHLFYFLKSARECLKDLSKYLETYLQK